MSFLSFGKTKEEVALVLDIGGGSVRGSLSILAEGETPRLMYSRRLPIIPPERGNQGKLTELAFKCLEEILTHIEKEGLKGFSKRSGFFSSRPTVDRVVCIFGAPWSVSETKQLKIVKDQPIVF